MLSVLVNTIAVLAGSLIGILFRNRLKESLRNSVMKALGLCTILIGVMSAIQTKELLCIILCMVLGTILGELLKIDDGIEHAGDAFLIGTLNMPEMPSRLNSSKGKHQTPVWKALQTVSFPPVFSSASGP